jgi:PPOX class probable F420-dependent enzyme
MTATTIIGLLRGHGRDEIPASHADLAECPPVAALTTLMPGGAPQTSVVWCDREDELVRVNTMRGFRKERNMRADPRITLLCYDPRRPLRYLEVRGRVESMAESGAREHLDALASKYMGRPVRYFGECIPAAFEATEVPVLCRIRPTHVVAVDATGGDGCRDAQTAADQPSRAELEETARVLPEAPSPGETTGVLRQPEDGQPIPASHRDLLERGICGVLTTLLPDGQPHACLVWVDHDGECVRLNTTMQRQSGRDLAADARLSLLLVDPDDTARFLQVRGMAELCEEGALEHLDGLTRRYTRHPRYYGFVYPEEQAAREQRVMVRIHANRVTLDAIHV